MNIEKLREEIMNTKEKLEKVLVEFSNKTSLQVKGIEIGNVGINGYGKVIDYRIGLEINLN